MILKMLAIRMAIHRSGSLINNIIRVEPPDTSIRRILYPQNEQNQFSSRNQRGARCFSSDPKSKDTGSQLQRIYYGSLAPRMKAVKVFSLTTSCAGLAAQPILLEQSMKMGGVGTAVLICGFAGFFTFVTPLMLHFITKKYVTEMHYNPGTGEYIATTISLFLKKIETKFRPSDVVVPEVPGMFTSFFVGKKPMFVDPALFENTDHYVRIMGYDKPIDFKLELKEREQKPKVATETEKPKEDTKQAK